MCLGKGFRTRKVFGLLYNVPWQGIQDTLKVFGLLCYIFTWQWMDMGVFWTAIYCASARDSEHTSIAQYYTLHQNMVRVWLPGIASAHVSPCLHLVVGVTIIIIL